MRREPHRGVCAGRRRRPFTRARRERAARPTTPRAPRRRADAGSPLPPAPSLLHPDVAVGRLSELLGWIGRPSTNTLADAGIYAGRPLAQLFPAPTTVPAVTVTARWRLPGLISEDLVFPSPHVPLEPRFRRRYEEHYRETHLVYARRIRPRAARRRPRLLYLHGYMQPETLVEELALLTSMALRLNVEVIQMQPPYHGRRAPRGARVSGDLYWTADLVRSVEALRQTLLDARALTGWLLAQDERPVGVAGLSLGGALTAVLTCLDPRFAFSIPLIAHMDLAALVADAPVLARMRRELRAFGWGDRDFRRFVASLGWNALAPRLPAERVLMLAASDDRFFAPRVVERMWTRWGRPAIRWYPTSHMGFIGRLPEALREMRAFVDARA